MLALSLLFSTACFNKDLAGSSVSGRDKATATPEQEDAACKNEEATAANAHDCWVVGSYFEKRGQLEEARWYMDRACSLEAHPRYCDSARRLAEPH